jgi:GntR family transcriptional repressor for pyruvate dehydrogenase complex
MSLPSLDGFTKIDRTSIKDLALEQIKRYITSGLVKPGERLPSERVLAERLGVGRNSVREALKVLEAIGFVESRIGEGTFITAQPGTGLGRTIGIGLSMWGGTIIELIEARRAIEVEGAGIAAERATAEDIQMLQAALVRMESATEQFDEYLAADMQFHRLIAQTTHNALVVHIVDRLITLLQEVLHEGHADQLRTSAEISGTHHEVFDAIVKHDPASAADAMRRHLHFTAELWQTVISLSAGLPDRPDTRVD